MPRLAALRKVYGVARSLAIYYGRPWRFRRMDAFYARIIRPGDLCFDLGAHVGNRVRSWRALGARVVAVEPQPALVRVLRLLYGRDPKVSIVEAGIALEGPEPLLFEGWAGALFPVLGRTLGGSTMKEPPP